MGPAKISISFRGYKPETYAKHFNVDTKYYDRVKEVIRVLHEKGCNVGIVYTVTKYNIDEFLDTKSMFVELGIPESNNKFNMLLHGDTEVSGLYPTSTQLLHIINSDPEYFKKSI